VGERHLTETDIALIQQWVQQGAPEGDPADLPPLPELPADGWQLGEPDLVVSGSEAYLLQPGGPDVYRNFVLPVPVDRPRWVRAVEIRPGNKSIVHHGIMQVDRSSASRRLDAAEPGPGFSGMDMGSGDNPGGHLIGWSPGKVPHALPDGMAWRVSPGTDLVLQLHLLPAGKEEPVAPSVGLFFTDDPPDKHPFGLILRNDEIDIPAGEADYVVEETMTLPVDVHVLGVYPHAHFVGKEVKGTATLPDGKELTLVHISDWDFAWQDEYQYAEPVFLPKGTELAMHFVYDNSAENPHNPSSPPKRVVSGNKSTDEMAILALQLLPERESDHALIREATMRSRLERNPNSWFANNLLGIALREQGRVDESIRAFKRAAELHPFNATISFNLGNAYQDKGEPEEAVRYYRRVLDMEPNYGRVHNNMGIALLDLGQHGQAIDHFEKQLELSPYDERVHHNLAVGLTAMGRLDEAEAHLRDALSLAPDAAATHALLGDVLRDQQRPAEALDEYRAALASDPDMAAAHYGLATVLLTTGDLPLALVHFRSALRLDPDLIWPLNNLAWRLATEPDPALRRPTQAVALAELVDTATGHKVPEVLDTLGAAYAATGQFSRAELVVEEALNLIAGRGATLFEQEFKTRLELYRSEEPYLAAGDGEGGGGS
jgi:tetratricopeptide (TPR) repeat protein